MRDGDLRAAIRRTLDRRFAGDPETRIVEEMGVWSGSVRIDVAVINGELQGYELKSARDTLTRLASQAALYSQVFDRVTLVLAERHVEAAAKAIPDWWGITVASSRSEVVKLRELRRPKRNPQVDGLQLARLLWRSELLTILERHSIDRGVRTRTVELMAQRLAAKLALSDLREEVRAALKTRTGWLGEPIGHKGQVSVHADLYPRCPVA